MSEDVISALSERKRVADIISERIDKNHIQIHINFSLMIFLFTNSGYTDLLHGRGQ